MRVDVQEGEYHHLVNQFLYDRLADILRLRWWIPDSVRKPLYFPSLVRGHFSRLRAADIQGLQAIPASFFIDNINAKKTDSVWVITESCTFNSTRQISSQLYLALLCYVLTLSGYSTSNIEVGFALQVNLPLP